MSKLAEFTLSILCNSNEIVTGFLYAYIYNVQLDAINSYRPTLYM